MKKKGDDSYNQIGLENMLIFSFFLFIFHLYNGYFDEEEVIFGF